MYVCACVCLCACNNAFGSFLIVVFFPAVFSSLFSFFFLSFVFCSFSGNKGGCRLSWYLFRMFHFPVIATPSLPPMFPWRFLLSERCGTRPMRSLVLSPKRVLAFHIHFASIVIIHVNAIIFWEGKRFNVDRIVYNGQLVQVTAPVPLLDFRARSRIAIPFLINCACKKHKHNTICQWSSNMVS